MLGQRTEETELLFVNNPPLLYPPEPLRWLGHAATSHALLRQDRAMDAEKAGPFPEPLSLRIMQRITRPR